MSWVLMIISLIVIWIGSLFQILRQSKSSNAFLSNSSGENGKRKVMLLIAHPDDESFFFSPTINYLISRGFDLHILCLSVGNADGMGNIRRDELYRACAVLKIPLQQVNVMDHPDLQDGFGKIWDHDLLAKLIGEVVSTRGINMIVTFDSYGVSGHCNHRDVHYGVGQFLNDASPGIEGWELVSINILRKYIGPVEVWLSKILSANYGRNEIFFIANAYPHKSFQAMAAHSSQWIWFRKLFVSFSSYTYTNTLRKIK